MHALIVAADVAGCFNVAVGELGKKPIFDTVSRATLRWFMETKGATPGLIDRVIDETKRPTACVALVEGSLEAGEGSFFVVTGEESAPPDPVRFVWDRLSAPFVEAADVG